MFALFRYSYGEPGLIACGVIITLTLVLAWLSFEYVERPTRGTSAPFLTVALRHFALPACAVLLPALLVVYATRVGLPLSSAAYLQQLGSIREIARPPFAFDWVCQRQRLSDADVADPRCVLGVPGKTAPRAILVGDSNAAHYIPMLKEIAMRAETRFRNVAVGSCPPFLDDPRPYIDAKRVSDCVASTAVIRREIDRYPLIIIGASWTSYAAGGEIFFEAVEAAVRDLAARSKTIILLGKAPILKDFDKHCLEKILRVPFKTCPNIADPLSQEIVQVNARLRELAARIPKVFYFDANRYLCPDNHCSRQTADGQPRYLDAGHLSVRGSAELGRLVVTAEGVPAAFAALRSAVDPPQ